jgi:hypothetical protein
MTTPQPQPVQPAKPAAKPLADPQEEKLRLAKEEEDQRAKTADPPVKTIADEQRERSAEIEEEGVEPWKEKRDMRPPGERPQQVPGVAPRNEKDASHPARK